ncbi:IMPACT family protein [Alysiella crassa]|uniref:IMPACT family member yigZ n=1 Tax=Alysiella crassa TaxID=153491 RepID=A0A376BLV5_9NEIS|nr:YigZ family protein [Alysiella crassa]UOP07228.1 IMPACT family protein [Alysiella crassa]SSY70603.1 IMPACT family member yigZ [Alysiella crassa]
MSQINTYQTLSAPCEAEFKDKGSRFIAYAYPVLTADEVKTIVENLRQEHHKARHWCYAYRLSVDGNQFRANDDGEPSGSAGRPILGQIDSFELTDCLVVVVRYFGGTLLGVSGLIHAYKTSTQMALQAAQIVEKNIEKTVYLRCDYPHLNEALRIAKNHNAQIIAQDLQLDCHLIVRVPLADFAAAMAAWQQMRVVDVSDEPIHQNF